MKNLQHFQMTSFLQFLCRQKASWLLLAALLIFSFSHAQVKVVVSPATKQVELEATFTVEVKVESGSQPIDGANIYLSFDPAVLTAKSATAGSALNVPLVPLSYNNATGLISYAYGTFSNFPSGSFTLFTVEFTAARLGNSALDFVTQNGIRTELTYRSASVLEEQVNGLAAVVPSGAPLPVTLLHFGGRSTTEGNHLHWATASEKNSDNFVVERSDNGKNFRPIATIKAAGYSSQEIKYSYVDKDAKTLASTHYYRLKQVDLDGTFEYSFIVALPAHKQAAAGTGITAYPNPFTDALTLALPPATEGQPVQVWLTTLEGKLLYQKQIEAATGEGYLVLSDLPVTAAGLYLLRLQLANEMFMLKLTRR